MKLIALLSWFDESPAQLTACIRALAAAGVDHVVAVDGRYALYPADHDVSDASECAAVVLTCRVLGLGCTLHEPAAAWAGNEVEKRSLLFALAWSIADDGDWFWVQDADQVVVTVPPDLKQRLTNTTHVTAEIGMLDMAAVAAAKDNWPAHFGLRCMFRAQPITVHGNHSTYFADDGTLLWGWAANRPRRNGPLATALDLTNVVHVEHHHNARPPERQTARRHYYATRDRVGVERGVCALCDSPTPSTGLHAVRWRRTSIGPVAEWMECCDTHAVHVNVVARAELMALGIDPDSIVVANRNGAPPVAL